MLCETRLSHRCHPRANGDPALKEATSADGLSSSGTHSLREQQPLQVLKALEMDSRLHGNDGDVCGEERQCLPHSSP
jgi:hypothetical protein